MASGLEVRTGTRFNLVLGIVGVKYIKEEIVGLCWGESAPPTLGPKNWVREVSTVFAQSTAWQRAEQRPCLARVH